MLNLPNIQVVATPQHNVETYAPNLRIVVKKFVAKNINEASLYKIKLLENKKYRKI